MSRKSPPQRPRSERTPPPIAVAPVPSVAWRDPRAPYLVPLLLLLVTRGMFASLIPYASEDAYITFRYAWNLAHGHGLAYNAGERVMGFTSAPWTLWLAGGLAAGMDPVLWSRLSSLAADAVTLVAFGALLERHASRASAWCFALFFTFWPFFPGISVSGLEMSAFVALIGASAWLLDRRHRWAGVVLGLLAVFRPEGLLAAGALALWAKGRDRWIALAIVALTAIALIVGYGSLIPQSVRAKAIVYGAPGVAASAAWWDWLLPFLFRNQGATTSEGKNFFHIALIVLPAALAGAVAMWRTRSNALAGAFAAAAIVWLSYIAVGVSFFYWYFATPLLAWVLLAAVGFPRVFRGPWVYATAMIAILAHWTFEPKLYSGRTMWEASSFGLVGDWLGAHAQPGETVMLEPIGSIGWRARQVRVLDEVGLVSPEVSARRQRGPGWYSDLVGEKQPRWLVVRAGLIHRGEAFAGRAAPFRTPDERDRVFAAYDTAAVGDMTASDENLVLLRRRQP